MGNDNKNTNGETQVRHAVNKRELLYDHTKSNEAIEIIMKMLDRLDRFDRMFIQQ
jgi:hypothetical protein